MGPRFESEVLSAPRRTCTLDDLHLGQDHRSRVTVLQLASCCLASKGEARRSACVHVCSPVSGAGFFAEHMAHSKGLIQVSGAEDVWFTHKQFTSSPLLYQIAPVNGLASQSPPQPPPSTHPQSAPLLLHPAASSHHTVTTCTSQLHQSATAPAPRFPTCVTHTHPALRAAHPQTACAGCQGPPCEPT